MRERNNKKASRSLSKNKQKERSSRAKKIKIQSRKFLQTLHSCVYDDNDDNDDDKQDYTRIHIKM